tara:strand:- start:4936 stop:5340 length:405 start_codon:yes stop_codon:yes gene_type:complete
MKSFKEYITELNRYEKETGKSTGPSHGRTGVNTPKAGTPTKKGGSGKDSPIASVKRMVRKMQGGEVGQMKKQKGAKSTAGTGKYKAMADRRKNQKDTTAADAKKRGFKSTRDYVNTMARYGGKDNYDRGRGLGS